MHKVARGGAGVAGIHQEADELPLRGGKFAQQGKHQGGMPALLLDVGFATGDAGLIYRSASFEICYVAIKRCANKNQGDQAWRQQLHGNCPRGWDSKRWEIGHR